MRRKLYFMLPDIRTARQMMDQMLLARIEARYIHFLARPDISLEDLPEATVIEKTDSLHGIGVGAVIGAVTGMLGALFVMAFPSLVAIPTTNGLPMQTVVLVAIVLIGAAFGAWWCGMIATAIPNSSLAPYKDRIEKGEILMLVAVPYHRIREIRALVNAKCGDACDYVKVTPTDHVIFP